MNRSFFTARDLSYVLQRLRNEPARLVTVDAISGSVPREPGAWMAVFPDGETAGTIGGGHLEWEAVQWARAGLSGAVPDRRRFALGPGLGQCCGGVVHLLAVTVTAADVPRLRAQLARPAMPVALFGGGHVGQAIARALAPLPCALRWIDSRDGVFPDALPDNVQAEHSDPVQAAVADLVPGTRVLVMSFSHAEDLDVVHACLQRQRGQGGLPFIGLIGSRTKWAAFRRRLQHRGCTGAELAQVTCPIGLPGIRGKQPEVIAAGVAAQLLMLP